MNLKVSAEDFKLSLFSIFICLVTYGFTLSNFALTVDSESFIFPDYSLSLGRWGTNLVRYQIFNGLWPYFTLLLGLVMMALTAVELSKIFKFNGYLSYVFCALFLSFPQLAYQLVFTMQADAVPMGFLVSAVALGIFLNNRDQIFSPKSIGWFVLAALLLMFVIAIYQALIFIPIIIFLIHSLQSSYAVDFKLKKEFGKWLHFGALMILAVVFYYISVKIFCPPVENGYLSSYTSGDSSNRFANFYKLWTDNLKGNFYYGEKFGFLVLVASLALLVRYAIAKKFFVYRFAILFLLLLVPYVISFFITNGYNPPRIYVASGIVFAFLIIDAVKNIRAEKVVVVLSGIVVMANIFFVTELFFAGYRIFNHDRDVARKINNTIETEYPDFDPNVNYIYFNGGLPYEHHDRYRLPNSEIFGGSLLNWDNGSNDRIINFFKFNDIAYYKMIDNKDIYLGIKDSINPMPVWPNKGSVKMINKVMVVKLNAQKGANLWVE